MMGTEAEATVSSQGLVAEDAAEPKKMNPKWKLFLQRSVTGILILAVWELISGRLVDPFFISKPSDIVLVLIDWFIGGSVYNHILITLTETIVGFVIGALTGGIAGLVLGRMEKIAKVMDPFIMSVYSLPKIALAPLFILWFGIGIEMKIVLAAVIVFFLVFFNTFAGVRNVDQELIDVIKLMGAKERQIFIKVILPSTLTWIFVGLKLSVPYALIGAIVGEIVASNRGIGYLIQFSAGQYDTAGVFASLIILVVIANVLNGIINIFEEKLMRWKDLNSNWRE